MKRLSDNAIEIVNELHTEKLAYESEYVPIIDALNRLAEYEDTKLEPKKIVFLKNVVDDAFSDKPEFTEHIRELLRAEKGGRLVVLPCKVGDTVWIKGDRFPAVIEEIRITDDGVYFAYVEYDKGYEETEVWDNDEFTLSDFGKTVFLTREAAEKALEEVWGRNI